MKMCSFWMMTIIAIILTLCSTPKDVHAEDSVKTITSSKCLNLALEMIPTGDFSSSHLHPEVKMKRKQKYNTSYSEGYSYNGMWFYGHDGLDVDGISSSPGVNDVAAFLKGLTVLSMSEGATNGWGESIVVATRTNYYSSEIITHHYHHMYANSAGTTRKFNSCELVKLGDVLGKEDDTGSSTGSHLHITVRRWKNIADLLDALKKGGKWIFGHGYTFGDNSKIAKHLDPESLLDDNFRDYVVDNNGNQPSYAWSLQFVLDMRHRGIEFGLFDGTYGAGQNITRREASRWLKIAAKRLNSKPKPPTFDDVPATDPDYPYIEALTGYPSTYPVINKNAKTLAGIRFFEPDSLVTRAAALKMVILTFYSSEFLKVYNDNIWKAQKEVAKGLLNKFSDVHPSDWFAPFVYFGAEKGLVAVQEKFNPTNYVKREEMAKWISEGANTIENLTKGPCSFKLCPADYSCDYATTECFANPTCLPSETQVCEAGGGYDGPGNSTGGFAGTSGSAGASGTAGSTGGSGNSGGTSGAGGNTVDACGGFCGPGTVCNETTGMCELVSGGAAGAGGNSGNSGSAGTGSPPVCNTGAQTSCGNCGISTCDSSGQWGPCQNQGECTPGYNQNQSCNGTGIQYRYCAGNCIWGSWETCSVPAQECTPGQTQNQGCTTSNNLPGTQSRTCNGSGYWDTWGSCNATCQDTYIANTNQACYTTSGGPTLCLLTQQVSGSTWQYQVCKQGGSFQNNYQTVLHDDNNTSQLGDTYTGNSGDTCSPWRTFSVGYINGYGTPSAAGVRAEVHSPSSCVQSSCTYSTGTISIRKECQ